MTTTASGSRKKPYPTRSVWPSIIAISGGRCFAITDYRTPTAEEGFEIADFEEFSADLSVQGTELEQQFLRLCGRPELCPSALADFPGFGSSGASIVDIEPVIGSTAAQIHRSLGRRLVVRGGDPGDPSEYIVATGTEWSYKTPVPKGPECDYHDWPKAKASRVSAPQGIFEKSPTSFTISGEDWHCAHENLRGMRSQRCHIDAIETNLCCRSCIFYDDCWSTDFGRLPCP